jgi:hypothetical protein
VAYSRLSPRMGAALFIEGVSPPFGGCCHSRETDIHGLTPRGKRSVAPPGLRPCVPGPRFRACAATGL